MTKLVDLVFRASTDQLEKAQDTLKKVAKESKSANSETNSLKDAFEGLSSKARIGAGAVLAMATAAVAAYLAIAKLRDEAIEAADKMNDLANRSNIAASRLSLLDAMAKMAGSSAEELVTSAERLGTKLARQDEESGRAAAALKTLGLSTKDANGEQKSMLQLQEEIILAVSSSANAAKAEGAAIQLLGNEYYKLRTVVKEAVDSKAEMYDYMVKTNALISTQLTKNADEYNDKVSKLGLAFKGMGNSIAEWALPGMIRFVDWATKASEAVASLTRRLLGGSTNTEKSDDTVSNLQTRLERAKKQRAGFDPSASGPIVERNAALIADLERQLTTANRDALTAREIASTNAMGVKDGAKGEGNRPAGKTTPIDPTSTPAYKEAMREAQERQKARIKENEGISKFLTEQEEASHKVFVQMEHMDAATASHIEGINDELAAYRLSIGVMATYGATQEDVTMAVKDAQIAQAQAKLDIIERTELTKFEVKALENRIAVLKAERAAAGEKKTTNDAEKARTSTFEYGWTNAFDQYKKNASDAAAHGASAFTSATSSMTNALTTFVTTGKLNFADFASSIISDLIRIAIQQQIVGWIGSFAMGSNFNGVNSTGFSTAAGISGGRATGGSVNAGETYLVGEKGPELLTMGSGGYVTPNHALGSAMKGSNSGSVVINTPVTVTMTSSSSATDNANLAKQLQQTIDATVTQVLRREGRSGGMLNPIGR
jgi:lambda family phage tail tape measure protein